MTISSKLAKLVALQLDYVFILNELEMMRDICLKMSIKMRQNQIWSVGSSSGVPIVW